MKKLIQISLVALLLVSVSACAGMGTTPKSAPPPQSATWPMERTGEKQFDEKSKLVISIPPEEKAGEYLRKAREEPDPFKASRYLGLALWGKREIIEKPWVEKLYNELARKTGACALCQGRR